MITLSPKVVKNFMAAVRYGPPHCWSHSISVTSHSKKKVKPIPSLHPGPWFPGPLKAAGPVPGRAYW